MPTDQLAIDIKQADGVTVVLLDGPVDAASTDELRTAVEPLLDVDQPRILIDGTALNYVNSTGFGLFFAWTRACTDKGGALALCNLRSKIQNLIKVLGLEIYLNVYPTRDEALAAMEGT